jgi:hypothetical protein
MEENSEESEKGRRMQRLDEKRTRKEKQRRLQKNKVDWKERSKGIEEEVFRNLEIERLAKFRD